MSNPGFKQKLMHWLAIYPLPKMHPEIHKELVRQARKQATILGVVMIAALIPFEFLFVIRENLGKKREIVFQGQQEVLLLKENLAKCEKTSQLTVEEARIAKVEVEVLKNKK